jgi:hypothetical protein
MSHYSRQYAYLNAELEYDLLGALKPSEVVWLSQQIPAVQTRYLQAIYGPVVVDYARVQYRAMLNASTSV